jgi:hypothetical protein
LMVEYESKAEKVTLVLLGWKNAKFLWPAINAGT